MRFIYLSPLILFLLSGLIVGSFLNVVILRYGTGFSIVGGRSRCGSCGKELRWFELVPVLSFIIQSGRCGTCRSHLSFQYPLVEVATSLVFLLIYLKLNPIPYGLNFVLSPYYLLPTVYHLSSWSLLIIIFVYDLRHKIIPDPFVYGFSLLALAAILVRGAGIYDILAGPILFTFFFLFWLISRGQWMGLGDAKLGLGLGWFLGFSGGIAATLLAFWIGAAVSLGLILCGRLKLVSKHFTMKSEIPFGPYLIIGAALVFFLEIDVSHIITLVNSIFGA